MSAPATTFGSPALKLRLPACDHGIGDLITATESPKLIQGVKAAPVALWPDDRGYFMEVLRVGCGMAAGFDPATTQVSSALSYPGAIKAFHYHLHQTDCWQPVMGMFQVVLVDLRVDSPTFGKRNTLYLGSLRTWQLIIPPGVGHGYKIIGVDPAMLVYVTDKFYNPEDEGRIAYNDPNINYDWETQHK
jgi:dTDP-4-dehydrorhamnose 3,5-epimerase